MRKNIVVGNNIFTTIQKVHLKKTKDSLFNTIPLLELLENSAKEIEIISSIAIERNSNKTLPIKIQMKHSTINYDCSSCLL